MRPLPCGVPSPPPCGALPDHPCLFAAPQEARSTLRARKAGVPTPTLYYVELEASSIYMEKVEGRSIRHLLQDGELDDAGGLRERWGRGMHPCHCRPTRCWVFAALSACGPLHALPASCSKSTTHPRIN
jgi:hypothetical protein